MSPVYAADESLSTELQEALQQALQGTQEEVEQQLQDLIAANPGQASLILDQASAMASGATSSAVSSVARRHAVAQAQQNQNNGSSFSGFDNYPVGGQFLLWQNNQAYALNVRTELDMQAAFLFTQLQNPSQFAINQSTLLGWWQSSLQFESCLLGASVKVGPYGSLSLGVSRGC